MGILKSIFGLFMPSPTPVVHGADGWAVNIGAGRMTNSGASVSPESSLGLSTYYACIRNISEDLAKLPLQVYRRLAPRGKEIASDHPANRLIHSRANPESSAMAVRETILHHAIGWGAGYAEIERANNGDPLALWPMHPSRVKPYRKDGRLVYRVRVNDAGIEDVEIPAQDVLHIHGLGGDGVSGYPLSVLARESIGLGIEMETFGASYFGNKTVIGGVFEHPGVMGEEAQKRFRAGVQAAYGGAKNAHKFLVTEEGIKYTQLGVPADEAQFIESRQFQIEEVCRWFRMPPHKVQHLLRATFTNIESQAIEYVVDCLLPWAIRIEQECSAKLLRPGETESMFCEHMFQALLRGDQAQRAAYYRTMWYMGAMSQNDIREKENLNPIDGGDRYYIPANVIPMDRIDERLTPPPSPAPPRQEATAALAPVIDSAIKRVTTKETKAIERAKHKYAGDDVALDEWIREFAGTQRDYMRSELAPVIGAAGESAGVAHAVELGWHYANEIAARYEADLIAARGNGRQRLDTCGEVVATIREMTNAR